MKLQLKSFLLMGALLCSFGFVVSCSDSSSDDNNGNWGGDTPKPVINPTDMKFAAVSGVARNQYGKPLAGVTVTSGTQTATTDLLGFYKFDQVNVSNSHALVKFSKDGYVSVVRSVSYESGKPVRLDASLQPGKTSTVSTNSSSTISVIDDNYWSNTPATIELEGGFTDNGEPYSGSVTATAVYLNPDSYEFAEQMPGDLSAVRDEANGSAPVQLVSYGMVSVDFTGNNGQKLELAPGKKAKITFPIPSKFSSETTPDEIPLWWFDETTGLWKEEGKATKVGNVYEGYVGHFSWWNLDSPEMTAHLKVTVQDQNDNKLNNVPIDIDGQRTFYTDANGVMKCDIPSATKLYVRVASDAYGNYANFGEEFKKEIQVGGDQTKEMTITIPAKATRIYGTVTNTAGSNVCSLYIAYGMFGTAPVVSDVNGTFSLFGPANYTGAAVLFARFADGSLVKQEFHYDSNVKEQRKDLTTSTASGAGTGMFKVVNKNLGLNVTYPLPTGPNGGLWTANVESGTFVVEGTKVAGENEDQVMPEGLTEDEKWAWEEMHMHQGGESIYFYIQGYDPSKTVFENATFTFNWTHGPHFQVHVNGKATVTLNNGIYNIKMSGVTGTFSDQMSGIPDGSTVTVDVEFSAKKQ